jgi:hypothetical protein
LGACDRTATDGADGHVEASFPERAAGRAGFGERVKTLAAARAVGALIAVNAAHPSQRQPRRRWFF